jgi:hypothetical protein
MNRLFFAMTFAIGLAAVLWVGTGFVGASAPALLMTAVIAGVYGLGAFELHRYRAATASLAAALNTLPQPLADLGAWLAGVHPSLQATVRQRIEGERAALPGPALTPYLVGLLVMLGMLGTFLGMVVTFKGAVFALEGSTDLHAIRAALAAPIKGLGLAFGTSVAGVAASAMLGLLSALSRRERVEAGRLLDSRIATVLRPFSLAHQRQETYRALQVQATALPEVVSGLQALMDGMERRNQQLNAQLLASQALFHREASVAYTGLADSVGQSLKDSLSASARIAGESLKPVVEAAMSEIAQESKRLHERVSEAAQTQLNGLSATFGATAATVSDTWTVALQTHARASEAQALALERALGAFTLGFDQRATALLATIQEGATRSATDQAAADRQRLHAWTQSLQTLAATQQAQWESAGAMTLARQQAVIETLEQTAGAISEQASEHARQTLADMARLLAQSDELVRARIDAESKWTQQHGERLDQLAGLLRTELGALRDDEATRGNAAVERLGELQSALSTHLATLGAALEAPMTRLMQTAAEVPQAAASVITQLREEMSQITERDTLALQERALVMDRINALLQTLNQTSGDQRGAIEALATSAATVMEQASQLFADTLGVQAGRAEAVAAQVAGSAVDLSSLGESFNHGVTLFSASNQKLMESLQRIEDTLGRSMARSDEQLAYYVAQAREVIDLSISSQQGVIEDLRRLHSRQAAAPKALVQDLGEGVAG